VIPIQRWYGQISLRGLGQTHHPKDSQSSLKPDSKRWTSRPKKKRLLGHRDVSRKTRTAFTSRDKFAPDAAPMVHAKVGTFQHWRIVNASGELHPMHIHQVHFLAYAENDKPMPTHCGWTR